MHIVVTNDDGYKAPDLGVLAEALKEIAEVTVVAPDRNCSRASSSLTLMRPLRAQRNEEGFYYVDGTPADCVHLSLSGLLDYMTRHDDIPLLDQWLSELTYVH
ncbi:MAG: 5'-nucleotidase [Gammaproteobacteria bacterium]|jgi:5'-nucleotidase